MIISKTPFRISFFGGGTDYPDWYRQHGGQVLSTTIDKYCYISVRYLPQFFEHKYRIVYSLIENVKHIQEIQHPSVREVLNFLHCEKGLEIHHDGDLPARSGLGSSSSFTVGLLNALYALKGRYQSSSQIAKTSIHIEQNIIREHVGSQDQVSAAYGGFNKIEFYEDDHFEVNPIIIPKDKMNQLCGHMMLFFTGISRLATEIAKSKIENFSKRENELKKMSSMVDEAMKILTGDNSEITEFGELLHESWQLKRKLSDKVSTNFIDEIYATARKAGATGGKILGAGGGGFLLIFAPPEKQPAILEKLSHLTYVPFNFDKTGSRIVLYNENGEM